MDTYWKDDSINILYWGSHPDLGNDDCIQGFGIVDLDDAVEFFNHNPANTSVEYIEIDLPGGALEAYNLTRLRKNPNYISAPTSSDDDWRREIANEAGMLHGADAYNESMGYDCEEYESE
jgi:hypothetical protein